ncbi:uncharacterized protein [Misgurnus anguillicaudatus]|uniref:uncharacterized protein n=1 Tax=Misgurnus anguillicaudatus TaxID=75329 RepID=UPI003CCF4755
MEPNRETGMVGNRNSCQVTNRRVRETGWSVQELWEIMPKKIRMTVVGILGLCVLGMMMLMIAEDTIERARNGTVVIIKGENPWKTYRPVSSVYRDNDTWWNGVDEKDKTRRRRSVPRHSSGTPILRFQVGETKTYKVDFCRVAHCTGNHKSYQSSDKYICVTVEGIAYLQWCPEWKYVGWNTSPKSWGYTPWAAQKRRTETGNLLERLSIIKGSSPENCREGECNPLIITLKDAGASDGGLFVLGADMSGKDPKGQFLIDIWQKSEPMPEETEKSEEADPSTDYALTPTVINVTTVEEKLAIETGFGDHNEWFEWVMYTARQVGVSDCIACATARPSLATSPFRLNEENDKQSLMCMIKAFKGVEDEECMTVSYLFPKMKMYLPPNIQAYKGNYTRFKRTMGHENVKHFTEGWCNSEIDITNDKEGYKASWFIGQTTGRADVWWMCGDMKLRPSLKVNWKGTCTLVQLIMLFQMFSLPDFGSLRDKISIKSINRQKRNLPGGSYDNMCI